MKLTAQQVKQFAFEAGCGDIGIANIERFRNAPRGMHPLNIFPDCKSVITIAQPIPRSVYRGITEGTYWSNYTFYGYNKLNTLFRPKITYDTACFIEDHGWEAVPVYPGVPERPGIHPPVKRGRPTPEINLNVRIAGVACGLGEIGWSKVFIHRKFGPRVRLGNILTDVELEPDPLLPPRTLCNECMRCVRDCPGGAIPKPNERDIIKIKIEDNEYTWGDVHMGRCTLTHHGMNWEASPFLKKDFPGLNLNVRESTLSEEEAYRLCYPMSSAKWQPNPEFPSASVIGFYNQIRAHTSYFAICGAKGCIRACMDAMEKRHAIKQDNFKIPVFPRKPWQLPRPEQDETGGIAEGKFPDLYTSSDEQAGKW